MDSFRKAEMTKTLGARLRVLGVMHTTTPEEYGHAIKMPIKEKAAAARAEEIYREVLQEAEEKERRRLVSQKNELLSRIVAKHQEGLGNLMTEARKLEAKRAAENDEAARDSLTLRDAVELIANDVHRNETRPIPKLAEPAPERKGLIAGITAFFSGGEKKKASEPEEPAKPPEQIYLSVMNSSLAKPDNLIIKIS